MKKIFLTLISFSVLILSGCDNNIVEPEDYYWDKIEKCSTAIYTDDRYTEWTVVETIYKNNEIVKQRQFDVKGSHKGLVGDVDCNIYYNEKIK